MFSAIGDEVPRQDDAARASPPDNRLSAGTAAVSKENGGHVFQKNSPWSKTCLHCVNIDHLARLSSCFVSCLGRSLATIL